MKSSNRASSSSSSTSFSGIGKTHSSYKAPTRTTPTPILLPPLNRFFIPRPPLDTWKVTEREENVTRKIVVDSTFSIFSALKCTVANKSSKDDNNTSTTNVKTPTTHIPPKHPNSNPFNTLFVGRLPYSIEERDLLPVMERWGGQVKSINIVRDKTQKRSKGYAFVEFRTESEMMRVYEGADGLRVYGGGGESRRIVVDYERGRTVKGWLPRRLGGGLGGRNMRKK